MEDRIKEFIYRELHELRVVHTSPPQDIANEIFRLLKRRKFRKRSASDFLLERIYNAIVYNISRNRPLNITFLQGSYKLWRLEESPGVDWAELFAIMYYTEWIKPILSFYEPGIVFDFYLDDLIMEKLSNYTRDEILAYQSSLQKVMDFLALYCPYNLEYKITTVSSRFDGEADFWEKLELAVGQWEKSENITLDEKFKAMVDLNYRRKPNEILRGYWQEENMRLHNAHSAMKERLAYREEAGKILAMPHHYTGSNDRLFIGSTKDSCVKYWVGVGALRHKNNSYSTTVLSPKQLANSEHKVYEVDIDGLDAKNFKKIRVLDK